MVRLATFIAFTLTTQSQVSSFVPFSVIRRDHANVKSRYANFPTHAKKSTRDIGTAIQDKPNAPDYSFVSNFITASVTSILLLANLLMPLQATAAESRVVGEIKGSGLVFKDTLLIESFGDPKVKGVTLYISNFQRPLTEKLSKGDLFSDPSFASLGCAKTGPVSIADNIAIGTGGEEVFEENKSLLFKQLRVQRVYDKEKNTVVYVTFNTRLDKNSDDNKSRFKSGTCAVNLD